MKPRTLWACQSVAFVMSFRLAPPARFSRSSTFSVLLPSRAPAGLLGTLARLAPLTPCLAGAVAWVDSWFSVVSVVIVNSPSAVIAVVTWIALVRRGSKQILRLIGKGDQMAMVPQMTAADLR